MRVHAQHSKGWARAVGPVALLLLILVLPGCGCERSPEPGAAGMSKLGHAKAALYAVQPDQSVMAAGENRLAVGASYGCMILGNGALKCWGINDHYQLGQGSGDTTDNRGDQSGEMGAMLPAINLGTNAHPRSIATANFQACALLTDSTVKCWGTNAYGELGLDSTVAAVGSQPSDMGDNLQRARLGRPVRSLVAGRYHFCALLDNGDVKCWGQNDKGQLGVGDTIPRGTSTAPGQSVEDSEVDLGVGRTAISIAAGGSHSCAILDNGGVKCWGWNGGQDGPNVAGTGQLGTGDTAPRGDGPLEMGDSLPYVPLPSGRTAVALAAGYVHTCAELDDGTVRCWGDNAYGQLGTGTTVSCGNAGTQCLGDRLVAVEFGSGRRARTIVAGADHTCAILDNGVVKCWGINELGQLGIESVAPQGDTPATLGDNMKFVSLGTMRTARAIAANWRNTCAWLDDGSVKCWGMNDVGQLGIGGTMLHGHAPGTMGDNLPAAYIREALSQGNTAMHNCQIFDDGSVKCWGQNGTGQLGVGDTNNRGTSPGQMGTALPKVALPRPAVSVVTGHSALPSTAGHSCALLDDGAVWCWGASFYGQLCQGNQATSTVPVRVALGNHQDGTPYKASSIAAGTEGNCAVLDDGKLKCWGQASHYELGNGNNQNPYGDGSTNGVPETCDVAPFVNVSSDPTIKVKSVAYGQIHVCALLSNGTVKCWGQNQYGQCGVGNTNTYQTVPGNTVAMDTGDVVSSITTGAFHICAVLTTGVAKCWGRNTFGQLGIDSTANEGWSAGTIGANLPRVKLDLDGAPGTPAPILGLAAGQSHTCAFLDSGTVKCWGQEGYGQIGASATGGNGNAGDEAGEMATLLPVSLGTAVSPVSLSATQLASCALLGDGHEKCWGYNAYGQLGLGDATNRGYTAATMGDALPRVRLGLDRPALAVAAGASFSCAILENGPVKCWGDDTCGTGSTVCGELGLGSSAVTSVGTQASQLGDSLHVVQLGSGRSARMISAGKNHACAVLDDGMVKCWGKNDKGQLGVGDSVNHGASLNGAYDMNDGLSRVPLGMKTTTSERTAIAVAAGDSHTCALLDDSSVKCWGDNTDGQLGIENTLPNRGTAPDQLGDKQPTVSFGPGRTARMIAADGNTTCALLDDASVKCWGQNASGELGIGSTMNHGSALDTMGLGLPAVDLGTWAPPGLPALPDGAVSTVPNTAVIVGPSCAVLETGKLKCWGDNSYGQLGQGSTVNAIGDGPNELGDQLASINLDSVAGSRTVMALSARKDHKCALLDDGSLKCWGDNATGQLGYGDSANRGSSASQMGTALLPIPLGTGRSAMRVSVGASHTCALLDDGAVKCWGDNARGELGAGVTAVTVGATGGLTDPLQTQMGDNLQAVTTGDRSECDDSACNASGTCASGTAGIDDGNVCTADSCTPSTGVVHTSTSTCGGAIAPFTVVGAGGSPVANIVVAHGAVQWDSPSSAWCTSHPNQCLTTAEQLADLKYSDGSILQRIDSTGSPTQAPQMTHDQYAMWALLNYLREGIQRLTGKTLAIQTSDATANDLSTGLVLTTLAAASDDLKGFGAYIANTGADEFNANEAYYIRTESQRTVLLANTVDGLSHAVSELLRGDHADPTQSVGTGYEVLGMGPAWTYVPPNPSQSLVLMEESSSRPGFYVRSFTPTAGQLTRVRGDLVSGSSTGTIDSATALPSAADTSSPVDETVEPSWARWVVGNDTLGASMLVVPGHSFYSHHLTVIQALKDQYNAPGGAPPSGGPATVHGFLADTRVGREQDKPLETDVGDYAVYIASDVLPSPNQDAVRVFVKQCKGASWVLHSTESPLPTGALTVPLTDAWLDVSAENVRDVIFGAMASSFGTQLAQAPDNVAVYGTDPEDGGVHRCLQAAGSSSDGYFGQFTSDPAWWPNYRNVESLVTKAYLLNNFYPRTSPSDTPLPSQPSETWWYSANDTINAQSDSIFALNNWLLHEWDNHVCPQGQPCQTTSTGKPKRDMVRTALLSYAYHDVPPNFNLDPRIYVQVSGDASPENNHRGHGKWARAGTVAAVSSAFQRLVPNTPSSVYHYLSDAFDSDWTVQGIAGSPPANTLQSWVSADFNSGFRGYTAESDFNFGKLGLAYYLLPKMLWTPTLSAGDLDALRTRWISRAFCGSDVPAGGTMCLTGQRMHDYYDFMATSRLNRPGLWALAIQKLADGQTAFDSSSTSDPWIQRRLDDVKQFWYFYYLTVTTSPSDGAFKNFVWKGQMSYTTAMQMVARRWFKVYDPRMAATQQYSGCQVSFPNMPPCPNPLPAHYAHDEVEGTTGWWPLVHAYWNDANFHLFENSLLSDGTSGATVDQNDLVQVAEFHFPTAQTAHEVLVNYNPTLSANYGDVTMLQTANAGDTIGVAVYRPLDSNAPPTLSLGISRWNKAADPTLSAWEPLAVQTVDTVERESACADANNFVSKGIYVVSRQVENAGTYKITVGTGVTTEMLVAGREAVTLNDAACPSGVRVKSSYAPSGPLAYSDAIWGESDLDRMWVYLPSPHGSDPRWLDLEILPQIGDYHVFVELWSGLPSGTGDQALTKIPALADAGPDENLNLSGSGLRQINLSRYPTARFASVETRSVLADGGAGTPAAGFFVVPYFDSVPNYWATNPQHLVVPRAVACADHLQPLDAPCP